ncbi:MAG: hypothetical protein QOE95_763, partial [Gaiellaceae bacterium]|nr:hypothetical protein [Gaiellaceae bacterium]
MSDSTVDPDSAQVQASGLEAPETASGAPAVIEPAQAIEEATGVGLTAPAAAAAAPVFHQNIIIAQRRHGPGLFVRAIWYLFIGWWLTGLAIV